MRYAMIVVLMTLTCLDLSPARAELVSQQESLRGLQEVALLIEQVKPDAQADGLSEEAIRTAVELILRSSGIRVHIQSEQIQTPVTAMLYVVVDTFKNPSGLYAFNVGVRLYQKVSLMPQPQHTVAAATWFAPGMVGTVGHKAIRGLVEEVESNVKKFANDFLRVNPR